MPAFFMCGEHTRHMKDDKSPTHSVVSVAYSTPNLPPLNEGVEARAPQMRTHWYAGPCSTDEGGRDACTEVIHASRERNVASQMGL
jgi:hypothetical protein